MTKKPKKPEPRIALQISPEMERRIKAAHERVGNSLVSLSSTVRCLLEIGLKCDEAAAEERPR